MNITKNINRSNELYLIFLKQFFFFKYNVNFTLNNNVQTFKFVIHLKIIKNDIFSNDIFKQSKNFHLIIIEFNIAINAKMSIFIIIIFQIIKKHLKRGKNY